MKEFIDIALSKYLEYAKLYRFDTSEKLWFKWDALIMCLYISMPVELKRRYRENQNSMETLINDMEEFLKFSYASDLEGRDGMTEISGYTRYENCGDVSCFSIYSLLQYSFMEASERREKLYKMMIVYPFCYECIEGELPAENCDKMMEKMDIQLVMRKGSFKSNRSGEEQNGKNIKESLNTFIKENCYYEAVGVMETNEFSSRIIEASFMFEEGGAMSES